MKSRQSTPRTPGGPIRRPGRGPRATLLALALLPLEAGAAGQVEREPLLALREGEKALDVVASADLGQWVAVTTFDDVGPGTGGGMDSHLGPSHVFWNGQELGLVRYVPSRSITFGPDGSHVAFASVSWGKKGFGRYRVYLDGEALGEIGHYSETVEVNGSLGPWFSPDGERLVWLGSWKGRQYLVTDGKHEKGHGHDYLLLRDPWTEDGRLFYVTGDGGSESLVVDGQVRATARDIRLVGTGSPTTVLAWVESASDGERLVIEGEPLPAWERIGEAVLSADGTAWAFEARDAEGASFVVRGQEPEGPWLEVDGLAISEDGLSHAYAARTAQGWRPVVDGEAGRAWQRIEEIAMLEAGGAVMVARNGSRRVLSVWEGSWKEVGRYAGVHRLVAGPGGRMAASVLEAGSARLVVDGGMWGPPADEVRHCAITFSPSGSHVAAALRHGELWSVVVDGRGAGTWERVECPLVLDDEALVFLGWQGGELERVRVRIPPAG